MFDKVVAHYARNNFQWTVLTSFHRRENDAIGCWALELGPETAPSFLASINQIDYVFVFGDGAWLSAVRLHDRSGWTNKFASPTLFDSSWRLSPGPKSENARSSTIIDSLNREERVARTNVWFFDEIISSIISTHVTFGRKFPLQMRPIIEVASGIWDWQMVTESHRLYSILIWVGKWDISGLN